MEREERKRRVVGEIRRAPAVQRQARQRCRARARARNWKEKPAFGGRI